LRQKSRESWLKLGGRNTKFFYAACKVRNHRNQINHLISVTGLPITDEKELREIAPRFYKNLCNMDSYWNIFPRLVVKKKLT